MTMKDQLLNILEKSREAEIQFIESLTDEQREYRGTYEKWSAKDNVAHTNFWEEIRGANCLAFIEGRELRPVPQFDQANAECFEMFVDRSWQEVEEFAENSYNQMVEAVNKMDEEMLLGPSLESQERAMWDVIVGNAYDHKFIHYSDFYQGEGQMEEASEIWRDWAELVAPLDPGPDWQGRVHYNAACGMAILGDHDGAIRELKKALELRPALSSWSRLDSDLAILHDLPEYKELYAPAFWWDALEASPEAEAVADQYVRFLGMFREAIRTFPDDEWRKGDTLYQRPAGLGLHIVQSIDLYGSLKPGDRPEQPLSQINWEEKDEASLPSQEELLRYLAEVEERLANFIAQVDFDAEEKSFPWTGSTILSRTMYSMRHSQHHLADMSMELQRRGFKPPDWQ